MTNSSMLPEVEFSLPTLLEKCSTNHRLPWQSRASVAGAESPYWADGRGRDVGYFLHVRTFGSNSTIELPPCSESHNLPPRSTTIPMGDFKETEGEYSAKECELRSNAATLLAYVSDIHIL